MQHRVHARFDFDNVHAGRHRSSPRGRLRQPRGRRGDSRRCGSGRFRVACGRVRPQLRQMLEAARSFRVEADPALQQRIQIAGVQIARREMRGRSGCV